jgi:hypothetical protein
VAETDILWPVGTTDQDPDLSDRPMVFRPKGFLVAILPDDDEAERAIRSLSGCAALHIRHYGHHRQSDFYLQRPTS